MLLILLFTLVHSGSSGCPPGYSDFLQANKCVKYVSVATTANIAQRDCHQGGGVLVSVQNAFVNSALLNLQGDDNDGMTFLGLHRETSFEWTWRDGSNTSFTKWAPGQPSNASGCAALSGYDAHWYSVDCGKELPYFCEHVQSAGCPSNWTSFGETCYDYRNEDLTWDDAENDCAKDGAHLASIHSLSENDMLASFLKTEDHCGKLWLGLNCSQEMTWTDGSPIDYLHDAVSCPVTRYAIYAGAKCPGGYQPGTGQWEPMPVGKILEGHVCESTTPCRDGWRSFNGCYIYKQFNGDPLTFEHAERDCRRDESHLVSIHSSEENTVVTDFLSSNNDCSLLWIGLTCAGGQLTWTDGTVVEYKSNPIACGPYRRRFEMYAGLNCGALAPDSGTWESANNRQAHNGYVCQKPSYSPPLN